MIIKHRVTVYSYCSVSIISVLSIAQRRPNEVGILSSLSLLVSCIGIKATPIFRKYNQYIYLLMQKAAVKSL